MVNLNNRYLGMVKQWQDRSIPAVIHNLICSPYQTSSVGGSLWSRRDPDLSSARTGKQLSEALEQVRNNRLVFVDVTAMAVSTSTRCRFAGAEWMKCVKQNGENLIMRRILSVLLEKNQARYPA